MKTTSCCIAALCLCTVAASAVGGQWINYDVTRTYVGTGTQTFDRYQPITLPGWRVAKVTIEVTLPSEGARWLDNENDDPVTVTVSERSLDVTLSSTDVTFTPIELSEIRLGYSFTLGPHDDPDGVDTLDAFQADSGNDWYKSGLPLTVILQRDVTDPAEIATFLGTGTFDMDYVYTTGLVIEQVLPGVSSWATVGSSDSTVRIRMTEVPEPASGALLMLGAAALPARVRRRRRRV